MNFSTSALRLSRPLFRNFTKRNHPGPISLALQGGGSFGAFTWGVLDRLLAQDITIDVVSGVSAGAVNAVLLADGLAEGGPHAARQRLERFWRRVSTGAPRMVHGVIGTAALALDVSTRILSPYQFNPLGFNLLRDILAEEIDFARVRQAAPIRLLIGATRAAPLPQRRDHAWVLASACLPHLQHAVQIDASGTGMAASARTRRCASLYSIPRPTMCS
jgi:NTE family protein